MSERGEWTAVGRADLWVEGRGRAVECGGVTVAVFRHKGRWIALDDKCPHMGASLAAGFVAGDEVQCSWHEWRYSIETGQCPLRPWAKVRVWEVKVEGGEVWLRAPEPESPPEPPRKEHEDEPEWLSWDPARYFKKKEGGGGA